MLRHEAGRSTSHRQPSAQGQHDPGAAAVSVAVPGAGRARLRSPRQARVASILLAAAAMATAVFALPACKSNEAEPLAPAPTTTEPNYTKPLTDGVVPIRRVADPERVSKLVRTAFVPDDPLLREAVSRSVRWFDAPSARTFYPLAGIEFERAKASVRAFHDLLETSPSREQFVNTVTQKFDLYESIGWDGTGTVLFTGYYSPEFKGSTTRTDEYRYPLYKRPGDLVTEAKSGQPLGRAVLGPDGQPTGNVAPYPTREQIEKSGILAGTELVWLASALDAYLIHVNGSAKLRLPSGELMYVGYAGKTDRPYASLGRELLRRGVVTEQELSLPGIQAAYRRSPEAVEQAMYVNESYVFFQQYPPGNWPAGSLGFPVTEMRSLATDKSIFPRGGVMIVDTKISNFGTGTRPFTGFMLDQDTGGAIKAPGRADIYMGQGAAAELLAGRQYQEGQMYYLFLKESGMVQAATGDPLPTN